MADLQPLKHAPLRPRVAGPLEADRAAVRRDRRRAARRAGRALAVQRRRDRPAARAAATRTRTPPRCSTRWQRDGVLVRDDEPAIWALAQDYTGPDGAPRTRHGFFARVRVEDYGPGRIRPHERTHPGPKEDRLRLTRATRANLSPIFSLYDDPAGAAWGALAPHVGGEPWGEVTDEDGTRTGSGASPTPRRSPRCSRARRRRAADRRRPPPLRDRARVRRGGGRRGRPPLRADVPRRAAGPGPDRLPHPPPAHRAQGRPRQAEALRDGDRARLGRSSEIDAAELEPPADGRPVAIGYMDAHHKRPADAHAEGPGDRRRARSRTSPSPTAGSTPRCSRR